MPGHGAENAARRRGGFSHERDEVIVLPRRREDWGFAMSEDGVRVAPGASKSKKSAGLNSRRREALPA